QKRQQHRQFQRRHGSANSESISSYSRYHGRLSPGFGFTRKSALRSAAASAGPEPVVQICGGAASYRKHDGIGFYFPRAKSSLDKSRSELATCQSSAGDSLGRGSFFG